ncbi:hypothetical protein SAMN05892883_1093 [Jatrophihabitans sp. GAS493]|uniref:hypothetical protein n=1 Tax=Jatrophihabitans sp. GAS493 TaxID=1907575 RepID=UPI000BBFED29|nr:hypothetical protein [Jatrophihabitans sp. GAS493]SOD71592.1 hypothetical protein SAMN05892883_1093 [Jatrophihabitans sp. GAS493]
MRATAEQTCKCGHGRDAHEHFRAGSDCGECSATVCNRFRRARFAHRSHRSPVAALVHLRHSSANHGTRDTASRDAA